MRKKILKGFIYSLFAFYLLLVLYIVFFARRRAQISDAPAGNLLNLIPIKNTIKEFQQILPMQSKELFNFYSNLFGNILLFFPLPFFLFSIFNLKSGKLILFVAFLTSLAIELTQYIFKIGVADVDDVLLNTIGAFIGYWSLQCFLHFFSSAKDKYSNPF